MARLAAITGRAIKPLNPDHGPEKPRTVAFIDEAWCIGCTLCLQACPVDAIFGSNKLMHTVLERYCTGCELCLPVCPVDCIALENASGQATGWSAWSPELARQAQNRYELRSYRRLHDKPDSDISPEEQSAPEWADGPLQRNLTDSELAQKKRAVIEEALARSRAKRSAAKPLG
ncbi:electron transport complex subunit RsxB [mine drainage metagenome]|uniref:Electron transport complex subunit RsxB n=1 Tax=mine drainage metagenome TaxID=410659 RepID=A0A1J5P3I7_9ZZZZ